MTNHQIATLRKRALGSILLVPIVFLSPVPVMGRVLLLAAVAAFIAFSFSKPLLPPTDEDIRRFSVRPRSADEAAMFDVVWASVREPIFSAQSRAELAVTMQESPEATVGWAAFDARVSTGFPGIPKARRGHELFLNRTPDGRWVVAQFSEWMS